MAAESHRVIVQEQDNRKQTTDPRQPFTPGQPPLYPRQPFTPVQPPLYPRQPFTPVQPPLYPRQPFTPVQPPLYPQSLNPPQNDYLFLAIISFFFCILLAIPALIFSIKTREANFFGDLKKAKRNSSLALGFGISSILVGSIAIMISALVSILKQVV